MKSPRLLAAFFLLAASCVCLGQTGVFSPQVSVFNNLNSTVGSNGVGISAGDTASVFFTRSVNTWSDTWWQWTMGTDNKLRLGFSTVPQLTLQNGAFGIGTDTPSARLDVAGNVALNDNKLLLRQGYDGGHYIAGEWAFPGSPTGFGVKVFSSNSPIMLTAGGIDTLYASAAGNVGIGTNAPTSKLDVAGNVRVGGDLVLGGNPGGVNKLLLTSESDTHFIRAYAWWTEFVSHPNEGWKFLSNVGSGVYEERMRIQAGNGNVGIGTTNPTHKLAVNGTIKAKEVIVETTGWSDYVFADDYALAPLADVEAHIKEHKHLPGIPSAAQVTEQGVSVGYMQARLLAKIEELTLHQIAQEKLLHEQKQQLEVQAKRINTLETFLR